MLQNILYDTDNLMQNLRFREQRIFLNCDSMSCLTGLKEYSTESGVQKTEYRLNSPKVYRNSCIQKTHHEYKIK